MIYFQTDQPGRISLVYRNCRKIGFLYNYYSQFPDHDWNYWQMSKELQRKLCGCSNYGTRCLTLEGSQQLVLALDQIPFPGRDSIRFRQENDPRPELHRHAVFDSGHMVGYVQKETNACIEKFGIKYKSQHWVFCPDLCQYLQIPYQKHADGVRLSAIREVLRIRLQQRPMENVRTTYNGFLGFCNGLLDDESDRRVQIAWKGLDPAIMHQYRRAA